MIDKPAVLARVKQFTVRRKYRDDVISQVSALRDSNMTVVEISKKMNLPESSIRNIIKHIL